MIASVSTLGDATQTAGVIGAVSTLGDATQTAGVVAAAVLAATVVLAGSGRARAWAMIGARFE